ncbi:sulfite exporter TauE/SafE family protein [Pontibacter sp. G13]|uniref:sulfite exporter TauE/SafE family protein n=1 Tax=Pontibacter sp. G13 TaxID=3074898 RepID=UPI00288AAB31|nr:sulfite exporter TauE/SafE family protein [Pontibacter sp. G13]WNJ16107.1 sulfite exporter TauE/SafE family protein [Pontibacter sp. G13]
MIWSAFILGLTSSLHCAGMCGPIALAIPAHAAFSHHAFGRLLYQFGRIATYACMGAFLGVFGAGLSLAGAQQGLSIGLGIALLLTLFISANAEHALLQLPMIAKPLWKLKSMLQSKLGTTTYLGQFQLGMLNGLLPCGFVYLALAGSLTTGNFTQGVIFMASFGLGTLPMMWGISLMGSQIPQKWRQYSGRLMQVSMLVMGVWLIARGMDLGIPYLSPDLPVNLESDQIMDCN